MFLCTQDEMDELRSYPWAAMHVADNFSYFVRVIVGAYVMYASHAPGLLERDIARAKTIGAQLSEYYPEWQDLFRRNGVEPIVRHRLSVTVSKIIVGNEEPFLIKLSAVRSNLGSFTNDELRAALQRVVSDADCPASKRLKESAWAHFRM